MTEANQSQIFTHFDHQGRPRMVDVSEKPISHRIAVAEAKVRMKSETKALIVDHQVKKGDVLAVSELAGIMGAKRTSDLIPLCHPIPLQKVDIQCFFEDHTDQENSATVLLSIQATVSSDYRTGVEMEALTACTTAALTVYDMCKAVDRSMTIEQIRLLHKSGGKNGNYDVSSQ